MTEKQIMMARGYEEMGLINLQISKEHMTFEGVEFFAQEKNIINYSKGEEQWQTTKH